jgi:hypothetical protein
VRSHDEFLHVENSDRPDYLGFKLIEILTPGPAPVLADDSTYGYPPRYPIK